MQDYDIGRICSRLYDDTSLCDPFWHRIWPQDGGYAALRHEGGFDVVVWRGSATSYDWALNFDCLPLKDGALGMLHAGFAKGVWPLQEEIADAVARRPVIVTGHSRGAAQACIFAGHLVAAGKAPVRLMVMGCPRPGYQQLADVLQAGGVDIHSYKNGDDPVTNVPFNIDLIGTKCDLPYVSVAPYIQLDEKPTPHDSWGPLAVHRIELYLAGLKKCGV